VSLLHYSRKETGLLTINEICSQFEEYIKFHQGAGAEKTLAPGEEETY